MEWQWSAGGHVDQAVNYNFFFFKFTKKKTHLFQFFLTPNNFKIGKMSDAKYSSPITAKLSALQQVQVRDLLLKIITKLWVCHQRFNELYKVVFCLEFLQVKNEVSPHDLILKTVAKAKVREV